MVNSDAPGCWPNASFSVNGLGQVQPSTTDPAALSTIERETPVRSPVTGAQVGFVRYVNTRGGLEDPASAGNINPMMYLHNASHPIWTEFQNGIWSDLWYSANIPYYYHNFYTSNSVFLVRIGEVGGFGPGRTTPRSGYLVASWITNSLSAINRFSNRLVVNIVPAGEQ